MRFHPRLVRLTVIHLPVCFIAFYALNKWQATGEDAIVFNGALGWIFWLGMFTMLVPALLTDDTRYALAQDKYIWGTIILAVVNMLIAPFSSMVTAAWVLSV